MKMLTAILMAFAIFVAMASSAFAAYRSQMLDDQAWERMQRQRTSEARESRPARAGQPYFQDEWMLITTPSGSIPRFQSFASREDCLMTIQRRFNAGIRNMHCESAEEWSRRVEEGSHKMPNALRAY